MGTFSSYSVYIEGAPFHGVTANSINGWRALEQVEALFKAAGETGWCRRFYEFSPSDKKCHIARVTRNPKPGWKGGRNGSQSFWVVVQEGKIILERPVKTTLRGLLLELYNLKEATSATSC